MRNKKSPGTVSIESVAKALETLGINIRFDLLLKEAEISGLPDKYSESNAQNILPVYLMDHMKAQGYIGVTRQNIEGCLACVADEHRFNPIQEYLTSGKWDGRDRFPDLFRLLYITDPRYKTYWRKWSKQTVQLGMNDEEHPKGAEGVLTLQAAQGVGKTSVFRCLVPQPRWFTEGHVLDLTSKDSLLTALNSWVCELGELDSTTAKMQPALKAFLTRPEDRIRPPYGRADVRAPRRTSFCATVNPSQFLRDETGSRRFWIVRLTDINRDALFSLSREWVDQFWWQNYAAWVDDPDGFRLTREEMATLQTENQDFELPMPYELEVMQALDYSMPVNEWEWWTAAEFACELPGLKAEARRVGKVLSKLTTNPPTTLQIHLNMTRKVNGITQYRLPRRHVTYQGWH